MVTVVTEDGVFLTDVRGPKMSPSFLDALSRRCEGLSGLRGAELSAAPFSRSSVEFFEEGPPPEGETGRRGRGGLGDSESPNC